jgi:hypothetical protein
MGGGTGAYEDTVNSVDVAATDATMPWGGGGGGLGVNAGVVSTCNGGYAIWGGGGGGWLTGEDGRFLPREQHEEQYCSEKGGMLIVSSYEACKGWNGEYEGQPNQGGDCSHLDLSKMDNFNLKSNTLYWGNSTFIHESLPLEEDVKRQLVRITLPADAEDLV